MIKIDERYLEASKKLVGSDVNPAEVKCKMFRSFSHKHVEAEVNKFLGDVLYVNHTTAKIKYDTSSVPEFSDKVKLYNHVVAVYYLYWPF